MKILTILFCLLSFNIGYAQTTLDNKIKLEPALDSINIAAGISTISKDDQVKFKKDYGYVDILQKVKVDEKTILFRVASISKLFVCIAIMQVYEEGKLELGNEITKLEGFDTPIFHIVVFGGSLFTFFSTIVYWLFNILFRLKNRESNLSEYFPKPIKIFTTITLVSVFLFYIGLGILFNEQQELVDGLPFYTNLVFSIPLLIIVLSSTLLYQLIHIWINYKNLAVWKKGAFSCIYLCLLLSIFQWNYWNLIGFNL